MSPDSKAAMEKSADEFWKDHERRIICGKELRDGYRDGWKAAAEFYELRIGALEAEITLHKQTIRMQTLDEGSPTQESPEVRELVEVVKELRLEAFRLAWTLIDEWEEES